MNPMRLAWLRLVRGGTGLLALSGVIGLACAGSLTVAYSADGLGRDALARAIDSIPANTRTISASFDGSDHDLSSVRDAVSAAVTALGSDQQLHETYSFRPMWDGGHSTYQLTGTDQPDIDVVLTSGRMPQPCSSERCEVLQVGPSSVAVSELGLEVVGTATLTSDSVLRTVTDPSATVLVGFGTGAVRAVPSMSAVSGSTLWTVPLPTTAIARGPQQWLTQAAQIASDLSLHNGRVVLKVPDAQIRGTLVDSAAAARRLFGLEAALSFMAMAAGWFMVGTHFDRIALARSVATSFGRKDQRWHPHFAVMCSVALGFASGVMLFVAAMLAHIVGAPASTAWINLSVTVVAATLVGVARIVTVQRIRFVLVALGIVAVGAAHQELGSSFTVPAASITAALVGATLSVVPLGTNRAAIGRVLRANLKRPLASALALACLAMGSASAIAVQNSALERNARDQAMFASPLDTRVIAGDAMPLQSHTLEDFETASGAPVFPVVRTPATVRGGMLDVATVQVLAVPGAAWTYASNLAHQTGLSTETLTHLGAISTGTPAAVNAPNLALGLALPVGIPLHFDMTPLPVGTELLAWLFDGQGRTVAEKCAVLAKGAGCEVQLPLAWAHPSLLGVTVREEPAARARREHAVGEGSHDVVAPHGTLHISRVSSADHELNIQSFVSDASSLTYDLALGPHYIPLVSPVGPVPVIADAQTASASSVLAFSPGVDLEISITHVADRMPTAPHRFVLADYQTLIAALARLDPSLISASELWFVRALPAGTNYTTGMSTISQQQQWQTLDGTAAHQWTSRAFGALMVVIAFVMLVLGTATAKQTVEIVPPRSWLALGITADRYQRTALAIISVPCAMALFVASIAAAVATNFALRWEGIDIVGKVAAPPVAQTYPIASLALLTSGMVAVFVAGYTVRLKQLANTVLVNS